MKSKVETRAKCIHEFWIDVQFYGLKPIAICKHCGFRKVVPGDSKRRRFKQQQEKPDKFRLEYV